MRYGDDVDEAKYFIYNNFLTDLEIYTNHWGDSKNQNIAPQIPVDRNMASACSVNSPRNESLLCSSHVT